VLVYRFYEGLDVAATAEALGCSPGTVKSQTARGLDNLRGVLGEAGFELPSEANAPPAHHPLVRTATTTEGKP
jgi:hypothetical protein